MSQIQVYSKSFCAYCVRAKNLLKSKGLDFEEINVDGRDEELAALKKRTGHMTLPQIFIDGNFVGGFDDLAALDAAGKLEGKS